MLNFSDTNIHFAFSVEGYLDKERKFDSRYVKYFVRLYGEKDGKSHEKVVSYHECDEKDFELFYPMDPDDETRIVQVKNDEKKGLFCVDPVETDYEVYGGLNSNDYQSVDIVLVPCNYVHAKWGYKEDFVSEECIADLDQQLAYLGPVNFLLYINDSSFNHQGFHDEAIHRTSILVNVQGNPNFPSWIHYQLQTGRVNDAISMV